MLGEFKRGKSTLVNALLADDVLPTGVLPLTAVATEISFGERRAVVVPLDGSSYEIAPDEIAKFVTEERNPENARQVARVELQVPSRLLEPGVVLVDTPGLGSIYRHNDEEARRALFDADGAILVLSADSPLSAQERGLLGVLAERRQPTFFVLNKIDHLAQDEADQVRRFVTDAIAESSAEKSDCGASRPGLLSPRESSDGTPRGRKAASSLPSRQPSASSSRTTSSRRGLSRLGGSLPTSVVPSTTSSHSRPPPSLSTPRSWRAVPSSSALPPPISAKYSRTSGRCLPEMSRRSWKTSPNASSTSPERRRHSGSTDFRRSRSAPVGRLEDELQASLETAVQECFEEFRQAEADRVEQAWSALAERFGAKTEARVNRVRAAAADLFTISLPDVAVPEVSSEREQFFYLFLHVDPLGEELLRVLRRVLPSALFRRRMLARAREQLAREFDKHAGQRPLGSSATPRLGPPAIRGGHERGARRDHRCDHGCCGAGKGAETRERD